MSFTDRQPRIATLEEVSAPWMGYPHGERFRCYLCGHRFEVGDYWRWEAGPVGYSNFLICESCDGPDVVERWVAWVDEVRRRAFWAFSP